MKRCQSEWMTSKTLRLEDVFSRQGVLEEGAGLSLVHQAFFVGETRCDFYDDSSVHALIQLVGSQFVQNQVRRLVAELDSSRSAFMAQLQESKNAGLFQPASLEERVARFGTELEELQSQLARLGVIDYEISCYNRGCASYVREKEWELSVRGGGVREA